jgi:hypothetical protein
MDTNTPIMFATLTLFALRTKKELTRPPKVLQDSNTYHLKSEDTHVKMSEVSELIT